MYFCSPIFLFCFLPVTFIVSRMTKNIKIQNVMLAAASLIFYAFGQLEYVPLFLTSVLINYVSGVLLMRENGYRKAVLVVSVVLNLGLLAFFKYTGFILTNINDIAAASIKIPNIVLPIGISFFTFQGMSYVIDTYRDPRTGTKNFLKVLLFISFFPQLIAGPIVKYHDIAEQIDHRVITTDKTAAGARRFIFGLAKKALIADTMAKVADIVFVDMVHGAYGAGDFRIAWLGAICYAFQIYFDFSGYSDMAIGLGKMFGFDFLENFKHPYGATSMKDFWRKWHISLSSWFKEYLYIPLGGNRKGKLRTALNKLIVFFCTGIWHGANWTFVVWGLGHGLLTSLEDLGVIPAKKLEKSKVGRVVGRVYAFVSATLLFAIFRADSLADAVTAFKMMFTAPATEIGTVLLAQTLTPMFIMFFCVAVILAGNFVPAMSKKIRDARLDNSSGLQSILNIASLVLLVIIMMNVARGGFHPFIYFQF